MIKNMKRILRATTIAETFDLIKGLLAELSKHYDVQLLSSPGPKLDELSEKYGMKANAVEMFRRITPTKDIKSLYQLVRVFRREKPDMVHSMTPKAGLLCMLAAWWTKVPIRVHTFTGLVWPTETGLKRRLLMLTDKITCACATHVIPEGDGVKHDMQNYHITRKPMRVLGHGNIRGVDMERFSRRQEVLDMAEPIRDEERFTFVFVGRIVRDKGINELCEAFERIHSRHPEARLILVGPFEDELDPVSEAARNTIEHFPDVISVGRVFDDDVLIYYAAADCFVFPSYREGFPNTVLEAGAMGLPSIVTDINGSREIIVEGENGTIIPSKDADALYDAMERMMTDREWRSKMAEKARQMIMDRFEQGYVQRCQLEFYEEIMK